MDEDQTIDDGSLEIYDFRKDTATITGSHGVPESICVMPWIHLNVNPTGTVLQCCVSSQQGEVGNLGQNTLAEIWNNDAMRTLRLQLLRGEKPASCSKCYEQESNGIPSFRVSSMPYFAQHLSGIRDITKDDGTVADMRLRYWDFRFSNLCNMRCRMCCHDFSSSWHSDTLEIFGPKSAPDDPVVHISQRSKDDIYGVLDQQIDNVEEIYFAGGEPLIMEEHYYILEKLIERGKRNVRLRYSTNLSKIRYKKWDNIELWRNFDSVRVHASLDACGPRAEYLRNGTVWETINENIRRLVSESSVEFGVSPTVQVLNLLHIPELIDYLIEAGVRPYQIRINNVLTTPKHMHINTLGPRYKRIAQLLFELHVSRQTDRMFAMDLRKQYDSLLSYMDSGIGRSQEQADLIKMTFKKQMMILDRTREENLLATFPELAEHWEAHKDIDIKW